MLIHNTDRVVTSLSKLLPDAFVFVIDTTDRTFLFKSSEKSPCQKAILQLDTEIGIDNAAKADGHFVRSFYSREIGMKSLATNTFVGYCVASPDACPDALQTARQTVIS